MCNKGQEQRICNILYNFMGSSEEMCQFYGDSQGKILISCGFEWKGKFHGISKNGWISLGPWNLWQAWRKCTALVIEYILVQFGKTLFLTQLLWCTLHISSLSWPFTFHRWVWILKVVLVYMMTRWLLCQLLRAYVGWSQGHMTHVVPYVGAEVRWWCSEFRWPYSGDR